MRVARAFAPGHITGFFRIGNTAKDFRRKGSRGAGLCLSEGVVTEAEVERSATRKIVIFLNNKKAKAEVTRKVAEELVSNENLNVRVKSSFQLPISQGLGISGAGALSTALALNEALRLGLSYEVLVAIAHKAELYCKTGLGDVVAQSIGGFEIRLKEGLPPFGLIKNITWHNGNKIVISVVGRKIETKSVLTNPSLRAKINFWGEKCLKKLIRKMSIENFFAVSNEFALKTGLALKKVIEVVEKCQAHGYAAQTMLGNSVFAIGDTKKLVGMLREYGHVYICSIGERAKILV
ncbi:MAG: pantoate kinase [Candidatus Thermoplasmatota archaeon]|nr:pantoate kinase [Candidatus Thermoplasmatota archaeon]